MGALIDSKQGPGPHEPQKKSAISKQRRQREVEIDGEMFAMQNSIARARVADQEFRFSDVLIERRVQDKIIDRLVTLNAIGWSIRKARPS